MEYNSKKKALEDVGYKHPLVEDSIIAKNKNDEFLTLRNTCWQHIMSRQEDHATERIVEEIRKMCYIYTTRDDIKSEIWIYDGGIYKPNGESYIKEIVRKVLLHAYTPQRANKVIVKVRADTTIDSDDFFNINYVDEIPIECGILNIKTREILEFTPKKIFFNKLPIKYDKDADCPKIIKFLEDILECKSDVPIIFELFGYTLLKDHPIEKAFMFIGDGRNGKGKLLSLLKSFLGIKNCCSVPLSQLTSDSSSVSELFGKLINLSGDLSNTSLKNTGLFKELTARDLVGAKRKYLRDLFFVNYSKQIFACNELPKVYDFSKGFWSRWVLLNFPYEFVSQEELEKGEGKLKLRDINIINDLTTVEELSGLLNYALDGLERLLKQKDFSFSKSANEVKNFWIRKSDSFTAFCFDNIQSDYEGYTPKKRIRHEFMKYCKKHKIKGAGDKLIKVVLEDLFGVVESRKLFDNSQEWVWEGIRLIE